jgi:hypothetical protein
MARYFKALEGARVITSCEDPNTVYVELGDVRYIFRNGEYDGWYIP